MSIFMQTLSIIKLFLLNNRFPIVNNDNVGECACVEKLIEVRLTSYAHTLKKLPCEQKGAEPAL